jgi:hypothetical protein
MREQRLLSAVKYSDPRKQLTFKEHTEVTSSYKVETSDSKISMRANSPFKFFIMGVSMTVVPAEEEPS